MSDLYDIDMEGLDAYWDTVEEIIDINKIDPSQIIVGYCKIYFTVT